jgi:hypothetical protein
MIDYKPVVYARPAAAMGQPLPSLPSGSPEPTPTIDPVFAGYQGIPGALSTFGILAVAGSAAWLGISTALASESKTKQTLGWVSGVGSALLGLFYLGAKSGFTIGTGVPAVNVYPS